VNLAAYAALPILEACRASGNWAAVAGSASYLLFRAEGEAASAEERQAQSAFLRDIFGNPFRPVVLAPAWLTPDVIGLARALYEERAFGQLPVLGDALEEAGCAAEPILEHCRQGGEHVRGCWVVDAVLGQK
jgi:hypothetical protein